MTVPGRCVAGGESGEAQRRAGQWPARRHRGVDKVPVCLQYVEGVSRSCLVQHTQSEHVRMSAVMSAGAKALARARRRLVPQPALMFRDALLKEARGHAKSSAGMQICVRICIGCAEPG